MKKGPATTLQALSLISCLGLLGCQARHPEIQLDNLASRSTVNLTAQIDASRSVQSGAYTRGEGAASGVAGGAWSALEGGMSSTDAFGLVLGVALVPVFATVGGVAGAATGTSRSREDIARAVNVINQAYHPKKYERAFEAALAESLEQRLFASEEPCITIRSNRRACSQGSRASSLRVRTIFHLAPADSGAGSGELDFLGRVMMIGEPEGVIQPQCISFEYRRPAGNIFDLAEGSGQNLDAALWTTLDNFAAGLPEALKSGEVEDSNSTWLRLSCSSWEFTLQ